VKIPLAEVSGAGPNHDTLVRDQVSHDLWMLLKKSFHFCFGGPCAELRASSSSAALLACLAWHCWRSLHCWPVWCIQLALSAARLGATVNREPRYTMSRFSTICMVSSESWKRLHSNLYAHDCTQFHFGNICSDVEMLHIIIGQLSEIRGTVPTTRQLYIMPP
jgi:hypothetical protein